MRRLRQIKSTTPHEFELDLAPLLAVMVKLVPVLLLSSAFVQVMTVETDLPQAVKEAIQKEEQKEKPTIVHIKASQKDGLTIVVNKNGSEKTQVIPLKEGQFDFNQLHLSLREIKLQNPEVFKIELSPEETVAYKDIVKITDEARRSRDKKVLFPVTDQKENKVIMTDFMFPDVVFTNIFDG
jgi:biopolymer transport protein ExbD